MAIVILGIDLGKNLCSVVGLGEAGVVVLRRTMRRQTVLDSPPSCRRAPWRWRRAAGRITSAAFLRRKVTT